MSSASDSARDLARQAPAAFLRIIRRAAPSPQGDIFQFIVAQIKSRVECELSAFGFRTDAPALNGSVLIDETGGI